MKRRFEFHCANGSSIMHAVVGACLVHGADVTGLHEEHVFSQFLGHPQCRAVA